MLRSAAPSRRSCSCIFFSTASSTIFLISSGVMSTAKAGITGKLAITRVPRIDRILIENLHRKWVWVRLGTQRSLVIVIHDEYDWCTKGIEAPPFMGEWVTEQCSILQWTRRG